MRTGNSIQLAKVFGIRVGASYSWFLVLFFMIYVLSGQFRDALYGSSATTAYLVAVAAAFLFFFSLLLHEFGHAAAARRSGISISGIDLWFFGGVAKMDRDTRSPGEEFRVTAAGPAVTLAIVVLCVLLSALFSQTNSFLDAASLSADNTTPALALLGWLALINAFLFVFNMVPAFPLDGGRIARAVAWKITGDRTRATRFSARLGQGFGYLMMGVGLVLALRGDTLDGVWLAILGLFLAQAAGGAISSTALSERLDGVTARDVMDNEPISVPEGTAARDADDWYFHRYDSPWFPVVDDGGRYLGVLTRDRVEETIRAGHPMLPVREAIEAGDGHSSCIAAEEPLEDLLGSEALHRLGALVVLDGDGVVRGMVTVDRVRRALGEALSGPQTG